MKDDSKISRSGLSTASTAAHLPPRSEFVVRDAYVMSMDPKVGDLSRGDVHVRNGEIVAVGTAVAAPGVEAIDGRSMIALPGFVDTHFHLWNCFVRGVVGDGDMDYFPVMSRIGPDITPDIAYRSVRLGITEALYSGLTTVHDWSHNLSTPAHADAEIRALRESGIRSLFSYGYSRELQHRPDQVTDFADIERVKTELAGDSLMTMGFAARGPGSTPPQVYRQEIDLSRKLGLPITIHANRSIGEVKKFSRIGILNQDRLLGPDMLLIHTYNATEQERQIMADTRTKVSVAPFTASRLASGLPYLGDLVTRGVQCSLSVDTTTVGGNVDMFGIMRLALQLNHLRSMNVLEVQPRRIVELATLDGAKSLGIADRVGSLTPGKRADLILIRTDDLNTAPFHDAALLIVQSAQPHNVDTVVVDGRILKRHRQLTSVDVACPRRHRGTAKRVKARAGQVGRARARTSAVVHYRQRDQSRSALAALPPRIRLRSASDSCNCLILPTGSKSPMAMG
ncbi:MAG: amidohydrolase family protein [Deltaproteobacteria bacterium]|nr:amidohydrolase family protein [Deltaproteobacteria bacterium]